MNSTLVRNVAGFVCVLLVCWFVCLFVCVVKKGSVSLSVVMFRLLFLWSLMYYICVVCLGVWLFNVV